MSISLIMTGVLAVLSCLFTYLVTRDFFATSKKRSALIASFASSPEMSKLKKGKHIVYSYWVSTVCIAALFFVILLSF